jgi:hypothetical protein
VARRGASQREVRDRRPWREGADRWGGGERGQAAARWHGVGERPGAAQSEARELERRRDGMV